MQTIKYEEEEEEKKKPLTWKKWLNFTKLMQKKCNGFDVKSSAEISIDNINSS